MAKIYMVGGAVRDILMDRQPKDIDYVVVGSSPEEMIAQGYQQVGADFPVFIHPTTGEEYALARTERKNGKGYNGFVTDHSPRVTLKEDLLRRDLTINAMAMDEATGDVYDPFGGQADLQGRVLKHVSEAFSEDPVRVLRLARFRARYGPDWHVHWSTQALCNRMAMDGELNHLTRERVLKELEKALGEPYPEQFFFTLELLGALPIVLPEFELARWPIKHALVTYRGGSAKLQYAKLSPFIKGSEAFEERIGMSTEWRKYAAMYYKLFMAYESNASRHIVDLLYDMDAYRNRTMFEELAADMIESGQGNIIEEPLWAWEETKNIGFNDLTTAQRITLKGPQIAEAIKTERKRACLPFAAR